MTMRATTCFLLFFLLCTAALAQQRRDAPEPPARPYAYTETPSSTPEERAAWFAPAPPEEVSPEALATWEAGRAAARAAAATAQPEAPYVPAKLETDANGQLLATFTVNSANETTLSYDLNPGDGTCDDAQGGVRCTLRAAIDEANATPGSGAVIINFALGFTINLNASNAPLAITRANVTLDGENVVSSCGDLLAGTPHNLTVALDGSAYGGTQDGLQLTANNIAVRGINIRNFPDRGIEMHSSNGFVDCVYIGTNIGGTAASGNREGIYVTGSGNDIYNSLISGNVEEGVLFTGSGATSNTINRSLIGTDDTGMLDVGNGFDGIEINSGASGNTIGAASGGVDDPAVIIAGNNSDGIEIVGAHNNNVYDTHIGLNLNEDALGNGNMGVYLAGGATGNTVGDDTYRNYIAASTLDGIYIGGSGTSNNFIAENSIGYAFISGVVHPRGNGRHGIFVTDGASNNTIGTTVTFGSSHYSNRYNTMHGIVIQGGTTTGNIVRGNTLRQNGIFGILIDNAPGNTIGAAVAGAYNGVFTSGDDGIRVQGAGATGNLLYQNQIGTFGGSGNGSSGIDIRDGATGNTIGHPSYFTHVMGNPHNGINISANAGNTTIQHCGIGADEADRYNGNGGPGIVITASSSGNTIDDCTVADNTGPGILLQGSNNTVTGSYIGTNIGGTAAVPNANGLEITGDNNTIGALATSGTPGPFNGGNLISGNTGDGVLLTSTASGNAFYGNFIGTNIAGGAAVPNTSDGIEVQGANNQIGWFQFDILNGNREGLNLISGNTSAGVRLTTAGATGNKVQANYIGLNGQGNGALPNTTGIRLENNATANAVGQDAPSVTVTGLGNTISGNSIDGVSLLTAHQTVIAGNNIGTALIGGGPLGNGLHGVYVAGGSNNTQIGGTTPTERNTVAGNLAAGIEVVSATQTTIFGNTIGTQAAPNGSHGVFIGAGVAGPTQIGGTSAGEANTIAYNSSAGIFDGHARSLPNQTGPVNIRRNSIHSNGGLGIDLNPSGPHPPPVSITNVFDLGANRQVSYTIAGATSATIFTVELYHSPSADPSGFGEGMTFVASEVVSTNGSGTVSDQFIVPKTDLPAGVGAVTLIQSNQTSEFSATFPVPPLTPLKAILAGAYDTGTGLMKTTLNSGGHLPLTQPYQGAPWHCNDACDADVSATYFLEHPNVVDWVYVEVRSSDAPAPGSVVDAKAALILTDGTLASPTDGTPALTFPDLPDGAYFVAVFHRNHLAVMTDAAQVFASGFASYDFTDGSAYGTNAQQDLGGGTFGLWGGDGDNNGSVTAFDFLNVWLPQNGGPAGYHKGDFNFSGDVTAFDFLQVWLVSNGQASQVP